MADKKFDRILNYFEKNDKEFFSYLKTAKITNTIENKNVRLYTFKRMNSSYEDLIIESLGEETKIKCLCCSASSYYRFFKKLLELDKDNLIDYDKVDFLSFFYHDMLMKKLLDSMGNIEVFLMPK